MYELYTDGAYNPVSGEGGWAVILLEDGRKQAFSGRVKDHQQPHGDHRRAGRPAAGARRCRG